MPLALHSLSASTGSDVARASADGRFASFRSLVASSPVQDLLVSAKDLFGAARTRAVQQWGCPRSVAGPAKARNGGGLRQSRRTRLGGGGLLGCRV